MKYKIVSLAIGTLFLVVLAGYGLWYGLPLLLGGVVRLIPTSVEDRIGSAVASSLASSRSTCTDDATRELMEAVRGRLLSAMPPSNYRFDIRVVQNQEVNAMAAPGGYIVVFSGLVNKMESPEQLAAVLAHEMQHVVQRHSMKGMVRAVGVQAFLSLVFGDVGLLGDLAGNLTSLSFMRSDEQSADDEALKTLARAGIRPEAMAEAFGNLEKSPDGRQNSQVVKYLSTHPPLGERIARVRQMGGDLKVEPRPIGVKMPTGCAVNPPTGDAGSTGE